MKWTKLTKGTWGTEVTGLRSGHVMGCLIKTVFDGEDWVETSMVWIPDVTLAEVDAAGEPTPPKGDG